MKICLWKSKNKNAGTLSQKSKFCETQYAEMDNHTGKKNPTREDSCHRTQCTKHAYKGHTGILKMLHIP